LLIHRFKMIETRFALSELFNPTRCVLFCSLNTKK